MSSDLTPFEVEIDQILQYLIPTEISNQRRGEIASYVISLIRGHDVVFGVGSSCLRSYLPESDIDLVFLTERDPKRCIPNIFNSLYAAIIDETNSSPRNMVIRNIEYVNARTNVLHCVVNNTNVDITVNQSGSVASLTFLEEVDRAIGCDHLFKRSVILVKSWCIHESNRYCGSAIIGAKNGMLSSYAVNVLVVYLFNKFATDIAHPFSALRYFLKFYSSFDWDTCVVTINGDVEVKTFQNLKSKAQPLPQNPVQNRFASSMRKLKRLVESSSDVRSMNFPVRACNIQDPINVANNLGLSVSRRNMGLIKSALSDACRHIEALLPWHPNLHRPVPTLSLGQQVGSSLAAAPVDGIYSSIDTVSQQQPVIASDDSAFAHGAMTGGSFVPWPPGSTVTDGPMLMTYIPSGYESSRGGSGVVERSRDVRQPGAVNNFAFSWFLQQFFPSTTAAYGSQDTLRADLRLHPLQYSAPGTPATTTATGTGRSHDFDELPGGGEKHPQPMAITMMYDGGSPAQPGDGERAYPAAAAAASLHSCAMDADLIAFWAAVNKCFRRPSDTDSVATSSTNSSSGYAGTATTRGGLSRGAAEEETLETATGRDDDDASSAARGVTRSGSARRGALRPARGGTGRRSARPRPISPVAGAEAGMHQSVIDVKSGEAAAKFESEFMSGDSTMGSVDKNFAALAPPSQTTSLDSPRQRVSSPLVAPFADTQKSSLGKFEGSDAFPGSLKIKQSQQQWQHEYQQTELSAGETKLHHDASIARESISTPTDDGAPRGSRSDALKPIEVDERQSTFKPRLKSVSKGADGALMGSLSLTRRDSLSFRELDVLPQVQEESEKPTPRSPQAAAFSTDAIASDQSFLSLPHSNPTLRRSSSISTSSAVPRDANPGSLGLSYALTSSSSSSTIPANSSAAASSLFSMIRAPVARLYNGTKLPQVSSPGSPSNSTKSKSTSPAPSMRKGVQQGWGSNRIADPGVSAIPIADEDDKAGPVFIKNCRASSTSTLRRHGSSRGRLEPLKKDMSNGSL